MIEEHPSVDNTIMTAYSVLSLPSYKKMLEEVLAIKRKHNQYNGYLESRFNQYKEWMQEVGKGDFFIKGDKSCSVHVDISPINFPPFLSLVTPPREISMPYLWDQYNFMMTNLTLGEDNRNFYDFEAEKLGRVADLAFYIEMSDEDIKMNRFNFRKYIDAIDKRRGTNFCKVFPELEEYYRDCYE